MPLTIKQDEQSGSFSFPVPVYCDGSISPASMEDAQSSGLLAELTGRIAVLIPELDYGLIEQAKSNLTTEDGNPASTQLEFFAIMRAEVITKERIEGKNYVIFSDCLGAVELAKSERVKFLPLGRPHYGSLFLHRILTRARYLRHSARKVLNRAPLTPLQNEQYRLFREERSEFKLTDSLLWTKILEEIKARSVAEQSDK